MSGMITRWFLGMVMGSTVGSAIALGANCSYAQITPDATLPNNSTVKLEGNIRTIEGGTRAGGNLFHSFREFSVPTGSTAFFNNATDIQNIISRVTGGSVSNIDGIIRTLGTANLFLINPNGIVFGANASLNVGGSFVATTANAIQFGNQGFFSASAPNNPELLTVNPNALLFNQIRAASIENNSVADAGLNASSEFTVNGLRVPDGRSLLLVGGDIKMDGGGLNAFGGRVELGGLAEAGTVGLGVDGDHLSLKFPENVNRASVSLTNQAAIYVEGSGGGNIAVNAKNIEILGRSELSTGIGRGLGTPETVAGDITLNATGEIKIAGESAVYNDVLLGSQGNGGNITIDSGSFSLRDGAQLEASTSGQGNAGNVTVRARDAVSLTNGTIFSTVDAGGVGKGGNININAATLSLIDGGQLQTVTSGASDTQPAGRGDAGNVNVNVTGAVNITGEKNDFYSGISSFVDKGTVGNGGNITIDSGSLSMRGGVQLQASTFGQGNAGNVTVRALDAVFLADNVVIFNTVERGGVGKGGNININAATLSLIDGAELQTVTRGVSATKPAGQGDAGNINVNVTGAVNIAGKKNGFASVITSTVGTGTVGNGGNITIDSGSFSLQDRAQLQASTSGQGNAGNVTVRAHDAVSLANGSIFSTVEAGGVGKGGNIDINAATLSLIDGAQLLTLTRGASNTQPAGRGDAGNVNVNVTGAVNIVGNKSKISSVVETGTVGNGGNITIDSGSFSLQDRAQLQVSTFGQGKAGNVTVQALDAVSLANGNIFSTVEAGGVGKGGNININAATLSLIDSAQLLTSTHRAFDTQPAGQGDAGNVNVNVTGAVNIVGGKNGLPSAIFSKVDTGTVGNGGNITIDSSFFSLRDGALLQASTFGQGNAGTIKVNAAAKVTISGSSSNINSGLFVDSQSTTGTAGDIIVTSPRITLDNSGTLNAESTSGNGGDINLQTDLLFLRRGAQISTTAGTARVGGDGGNITINAPNGFIVAGARENSDITANAYTGNGGRVQINTSGVYGTQFREKENSQTNDITASSQFGVNGTVTVNTLGIDPTQGLVNLPVIPVDTKVAQGCYAGGTQAQSEFIITGRGGLPPNPGEPLSTDAVSVNLVTLENQEARHHQRNRATQSQSHTKEHPHKSSSANPPTQIVEAQGWIVNKNGDVELVAFAPTATPHNPRFNPASCQQERK